MIGIRHQKIFALAFWLWIVAMFVFYIGSFGPVLRVLLSALLP
jgi:hypothetical protein